MVRRLLYVTGSVPGSGTWRRIRPRSSFERSFELEAFYARSSSETPRRVSPALGAEGNPEINDVFFVTLPPFWSRKARRKLYTAKVDCTGHLSLKKKFALSPIGETNVYEVTINYDFTHSLCRHTFRNLLLLPIVEEDKQIVCC